jgi:hypothetical protein
MHFTGEKLECQRNRNGWPERRGLKANRKEGQKEMAENSMGFRPHYPDMEQKQSLGDLGRHQQGVLYLFQSSQASPQGIVLSQ